MKETIAIMLMSHQAVDSGRHQPGVRSSKLEQMCYVLHRKVYLPFLMGHREQRKKESFPKRNLEGSTVNQYCRGA